MSSQPLPPKKVVALALIEQSSVHLHLDPRASGVVVPAWFKQQPQLVLQVGMNMPVPIPDLYFDDEKMSCTLSFNRAPFFCIVPWEAVFAMVGDDGRGMVWPESLPPEVAKARSGPREATPEEVKAKAKTTLKIVGPSSSEKKVADKKAEPKKADAKKTAANKSAKKTTKPVAADKKKSKATKSAPTTKTAKKAAKKSPSATKASAKKTAVNKTAPKKTTAKKPAEKKTAKREPATESRGPKPEPRIVRLPSEGRAKTEEAPPRAAQATRKPQGNSTSKPKRELPPYLRVVK